MSHFIVSDIIATRRVVTRCTMQQAIDTQFSSLGEFFTLNLQQAQMRIFSVAATPMPLPPSEPPPPASVPPTLPTPDPNQTLSLDPPSQIVFSQTLLPPTHSDNPPPSQPPPLHSGSAMMSFITSFTFKPTIFFDNDKRGRNL